MARRFSAHRDKLDLDVSHPIKIEIGYLVISGHSRVKLKKYTRDNQITYELTSRHHQDSFSLPIPEPDFNRLWSLTDGRRLSKCRYTQPDWSSVSVYEGSLDGLVIVRPAFFSYKQSQSFDVTQEWIIREVTEDPRYETVSLAVNGSLLVDI